MELQKITYAKTHNEEFYKVLRKRVNQYFKEKNVSRFANTNMVLKTLFMLTLYTVPFIFSLLILENTALIVLMWIIMGFGMAGIGLSIMHDANHGAYSKKEFINKSLGKLLVVVGGSDVNWRVQHNVLHHTYTNIAGMDEDIDSGILLRFSPNQKLLKGHRFQHIYAWFLYGLMTLMWTTTKDFKQFRRYKKNGLIKTQGVPEKKVFTTLIFSKIIYLGAMLVLPIIFSSMAWWGTVLCFLLMHFIAGLVLACIFQPAHVVPTSSFPLPDESGHVDSDWAVNQLVNTANFAPKAKIFSWYVGGLNYQVEHHLFPNICHIHYSKIAPIVKQTAEEFKLPYHSYKTFASALGGHARMLYNLGKYQNAPGIH